MSSAPLPSCSSRDKNRRAMSANGSTAASFVYSRTAGSNIEGKTSEELADATILKVKQLSQRLAIPNLKTWGIDQVEFENALDKMASDAINSGSPGYNPRVPSHEEVVALYRRCYDYDFSTSEDTSNLTTV